MWDTACRAPNSSSRAAAIIVSVIAVDAIMLIRPGLLPLINTLGFMIARMSNVQQQQARLDEAFERIEVTILPCIAMMLETLLDASANLAEIDPKALAAELQTLAAELEALTRAVERNSPANVEPGEYRIANA